MSRPESESSSEEDEVDDGPASPACSSGAPEKAEEAAIEATSAEEEETRLTTAEAADGEPQSNAAAPDALVIIGRREEDEEYNSLASSYELAVSERDDAIARLQAMRDILGGGPLLCSQPTRHNALADTFMLKLLVSTHHIQSGKKFVPGGPCRATRLGTTTPSGPYPFPHVLAENSAGDTLYHCETEKLTTLRLRLYRRDGGEEASESEVLRELNATRASGPRIVHLRFGIRLKMDYVSDDGKQLTDPLGSGPFKTFDRCVEDDATGESQLLSPSESSGYYSQAMRSGRCDWTFQINSGVTSHRAIPRKSLFLFEARCLNEELSDLATTSPSFWISSKFRSGIEKLERAELWVESPSGPMRVQHRVRNRARTPYQQQSPSSNAIA